MGTAPVIATKIVVLVLTLVTFLCITVNFGIQINYIVKTEWAAHGSTGVPDPEYTLNQKTKWIQSIFWLSFLAFAALGCYGAVRERLVITWAFACLITITWVVRLMLAAGKHYYYHYDSEVAGLIAYPLLAVAAFLEAVFLRIQKNRNKY